MSWDELGRDARDENRKDRDKWIGVYIGILAVLLAICSTAGGNASKDATAKNIEASNVWAFFQAKNMRRTSFQLAADELDLMLATNTALPPEARKAIEDRSKAYRATIQRLTSEPERKEGLDELFARAKALEADRDVAFRRDPYFDYSQALLQIAIVLASVSLISGSTLLIVGSAVLALLGTLLGLNGFTLVAAVPFIG